MPIEERSLERAIGVLRDHLNGVLARTISQARLIVFAVPDIDPPQIGVHLREGTDIGARLRATYGNVRLLLTQRCISTVAGRGRRRTHRLHTVHYRYAIRVEDAEEPFIRWEYERDRAEGQWCRHHVQGPQTLRVAASDLSLNDLHLPTGWVTIEEVIRFCIVDLGVPTNPAHDWNAVLEDSYRTFRTNFAPIGEV